MAWVTRALFAGARRRDELSRKRLVAQRLEAVAALWAERAGITREQAAVGNNPDARIPTVLLGLRIGSCQLEIPCVVAGLQATATITHDFLHGQGLRLVIRPRVPFGNTAWAASPAQMAKVRHIEASNDSRCLLDGVWVSQMWHDDYLEPTMVGHADLVELGVRDALSTRWAAHLLGPFTDADHWRGSLSGADVSLNVYSSKEQRTGLAANAQDPRCGALRRTIAWATWRRDDATPDYGRLVRADLKFARPVTSLEAETYLLNHLCRLLHLYSGARPTICGLWDPEESAGRLLDLGRRVHGERRRVVGGSVILGSFLQEVAPGWDALSEGDRTSVKIAMDALAAMASDLEPSVTAGAMTLEFLAEAFLPETSNGYPLTKTQRKDIRKGLAALAAEVAPSSTWEQDLDRLQSRLFQAPAADRITELMAAFGVRTTPSELKAYTNVRNAVTHGRPREATATDKAAATHLQLHAGSLVLLRKVGYTGDVQDVRDQRSISPRQGSRVK